MHPPFLTREEENWYPSCRKMVGLTLHKPLYGRLPPDDNRFLLVRAIASKQHDSAWATVGFLPGPAQTLPRFTLERLGIPRSKQAPHIVAGWWTGPGVGTCEAR